MSIAFISLIAGLKIWVWTLQMATSAAMRKPEIVCLTSCCVCQISLKTELRLFEHERRQHVQFSDSTFYYKWCLLLMQPAEIQLLLFQLAGKMKSFKPQKNCLFSQTLLCFPYCIISQRVLYVTWIQLYLYCKSKKEKQTYLKTFFIVWSVFKKKYS